MGNFFPVGKVGANTIYQDKTQCELLEGQDCFDITGRDLEVLTVVDVQEPVTGPVIKERPLLDEIGNPVIDPDTGATVMEKYIEYEHLKDAEGNLLFKTVKHIEDDPIKVEIRDQNKAEKEAKKIELKQKLDDLKINGHKDVKTIIEILGL